MMNIVATTAAHSIRSRSKEGDPRVYEYRTLQQEQLDEWFDHCARSFEGDFLRNRERFAAHWFNDPRRDPGTVLIALSDGKIVSTVRVFKRTYYLQGESVRVGGIGEVSTDPNHRKKGLAGELMRRSIPLIRELEYPVSMLGAIIRDFYAKFGWRQVVMPQRISQVAAHEIQRGRTLRRLRIDDDLSDLREIHAEFSARFNGATVRSEEYWTRWVKPQFEDNAWVLEDHHDRLIAYAVVEEQDGLINVKEFCARNGQERAFDDAVALLFEQIESRKGDGRVKHPCCIPTTMPTSLKTEWPYNMFRLISPFEMNGNRIETTDDLVRLIIGNSSDPDCPAYLYWHTDSI